jgi:hypothetical protein
VRQPNFCRRVREPRWERLLLCALFPALLTLSSCGSSTPAAAPTIAVTGSLSSVNVNGTVQFTATIVNLSSTLVSWQVNSTPSGNATVGTIDSNGLYTAPKAVPTPNNVVTITAVAQAQTGLTGTATVTILPPAAITGITPNSNVTVAAGASQAFTATVSGGGNIAVNWFINNSAACSSTIGFKNGLVNGAFPFGQITNQGNYIASQIPPPGGAIAITAVSQLDPTQTFCVPVAVTFGNASLQGSYAFSTRGRIVSTNAFFARAGSFTASCSNNCAQGTLTGGLEDSNQGGIVKIHNFTGTYSIAADGRGSMQFCEDISTPCTTGAATAFFRIVVSSSQQAQMIEFSPTGSASAIAATGGEMNLQPDSSAFNNGGLTGTYSFNFTGVTSLATGLESAVGQFSANGNGLISAGGIATPGTIDLNPGGSQPLIASTYSVSQNGRGVATISTAGTTLHFSVYVISSSRAKFIQTDPSPASILVGDAFKQQTALTCSWGTNVLNGSMLLQTIGSAGSPTPAEITDIFSFTADGAGGITAATGDQNIGGTFSSVPSGSGTYQIVDPCGRGTIAISGRSYVFYIISPSNSVVLETTSGVVASGFLVHPAAGPFTDASFTGSYALVLAGSIAAGNARQDIVGQLTSNGSGVVSVASLDINALGATQTGVANTGTYLPTPAGTLRGTMLLGSPARNFVLYLVSPTQFYVLGADATGTALGSLNKQF